MEQLARGQVLYQSDERLKADLEAETATWTFVLRMQYLDACAEVQRPPLLPLLSEKMIRCVLPAEWREDCLEQLFAHPAMAEQEPWRLCICLLPKTRDDHLHRQLWTRILMRFLPDNPSLALQKLVPFYVETYGSFVCQEIHRMGVGSETLPSGWIPKSVFGQKLLLSKPLGFGADQQTKGLIAFAASQECFDQAWLEPVVNEPVKSHLYRLANSSARCMQWMIEGKKVKLNLRNSVQANLLWSLVLQGKSDILTKALFLKRLGVKLCANPYYPNDEGKWATYSLGLDTSGLCEYWEKRDIWMLFTDSTKVFLSNRAKQIAICILCVLRRQLGRGRKDIASIILALAMNAWLDAERQRELGDWDCRD